MVKIPMELKGIRGSGWPSPKRLHRRMVRYPWGWYSLSTVNVIPQHHHWEPKYTPIQNLEVFWTPQNSELQKSTPPGTYPVLCAYSWFWRKI